MCGRYGRRADKQRIAEWMEAHEDNVFDDSYFAPSFNIAPQSIQPIVRTGRDTGKPELTVMKWGLVPYWAQDSRVGFSTINAKAETIATSPTFREPWKSRRCLVPAEWFYEWKKIDEKTRQPHAISLQDGSLFAFAGLWDRWNDRESGAVLETYTIITTDPNELTQTIHDRMPVILARKDYARWLTASDPAHLPVDLLKPYPAEQMKAWKVSKAVGNTRNDDPSLIQPAQEEEPGTQLALFG